MKNGSMYAAWWERLRSFSSRSRRRPLVISAYITPGLTSRLHVHSGAEAFYVVDGEQCLETETRIYRMKKGETAVVPAGVTMRLVATGSTPRRALAVIVYDAERPTTTRMETGPQLVPCT
jgi:quercetin dioxygenase-like cupin family protein